MNVRQPEASPPCGRAVGRWWVGIVLLAVLLAGCSTGGTGCVPPVTGANAPETAPSSGGPHGVTITLRVLDDRDGKPVPHAGVAFVWNRDYVGNPNVESPPLVVLYLRTDEQGIVRAGVPYDRYVMATAWAEGLTEEWHGLHETRAQNATWQLRLYPASLHFIATGVYPGPVAVYDPLDESTTWKPQEFTLSPKQETVTALRERMVEFQATLSWNTTPFSRADFILGIGPSTNQMDASTDRTFYKETGPHSAAFRWSGDGNPAWLGTTGVAAGPAIGYTLVAPDGVPYQVAVITKFDERSIKEKACGTAFPSAPQELYDSAKPSHNPKDPPQTYRSNAYSPSAVTLALLALLGAAMLARRR